LARFESRKARASDESSGINMAGELSVMYISASIKGVYG
jgi:hypothetical protein